MEAPGPQLLPWGSRESESNRSQSLHRPLDWGTHPCTVIQWSALGTRGAGDPMGVSIAESKVRRDSTNTWLFMSSVYVQSCIPNIATTIANDSMWTKRKRGDGWRRRLTVNGSFPGKQPQVTTILPQEIQEDIVNLLPDRPGTPKGPDSSLNHGPCPAENPFRRDQVRLQR